MFLHEIFALSQSLLFPTFVALAHYPCLLLWALSKMESDRISYAHFDSVHRNVLHVAAWCDVIESSLSPPTRESVHHEDGLAKSVLLDHDFT
jgi:hypothetical protein